MRIAQVAPLYERVPPKLYGGTERVVSYLTEALVELGHDVSLYASGDSVTNAELRSWCPQALRLDPQSIDPLADHVAMMENVFRESDEFDFVHSHVDYMGFSLLRRMRTPSVTTLHGRLDLPNLQCLYNEFTETPVVSISASQRSPLPQANWQATIHHGLPRDLYSLHEKPGGYLAFLGRISPEKRVDTAIQIANHFGMPLKIAAKIDKVDREYYEARIRPLIDGRQIELIGEIGEKDKDEFLGNAYALLFPIDWPEPFGLVMVEAMACGTPVVAFPKGSVPEVMREGITGYVVDDAVSAAQALGNVSNLCRRRCREIFERHYTAERMARDYVAIYERLRESDGACDVTEEAIS